MADSKQVGPGQIPAGGKTAAQQRAEWLQALEAERDGYASLGQQDRAKAVEAAIKDLTAKAKPAAKSTREG